MIVARLLALGLGIASSTCFVPASAQRLPGTSDPTFGIDGRVILKIAPRVDFTLIGAARTPDGKVIIGGNAAFDASCGGMAFARFNADGTLDGTFGSSGWLAYQPDPYCAPGQPSSMQAMVLSRYGDQAYFVGRTRGQLMLGILGTSGPGSASAWPVWGFDTFAARAVAPIYSGEVFVAGSDVRADGAKSSAFLRLVPGVYDVDRNFGVNGELKLPLGDSDEAVGVIDGNDSNFIYFASNVTQASSPTGADIVVGRMTRDGAIDVGWNLGATYNRIDFNGLDDRATVLALDPQNELIVVGSAGRMDGAMPSTAPAVARIRRDTGELYPYFGQGSGKAVVEIGPGFDGEFTAFANGGWIDYLAAGRLVDRATGDRSTLVFRFDNGAYPTYGFGQNGLATSPRASDPRGIAPFDTYGGSGGFLVVGSTGTTSALSKFTPSGLDLAYSASGRRLFDAQRPSGWIQHEGGFMAMQPDGRIVLTAELRAENTKYAVLLGLTPDGAADPNFGSANGAAFFTSTDGSAPVPRGIALDSQQRIYVASTTGSGGLVLGRFLADGSRDPAFSGGADISLAPLWSLTAVGIQAGDRLVAVGASLSDGVIAARFLADGAPDRSFGNGGYTILGMDGMFTERGIRIQADGRILVTGTYGVGGASSPLTIVRLLADGSLDTSWGSSGVAMGPAGAAWDAIVQADGKTLAAGDCANGAGGFGACIVRFDAAGLLDAAFGSAGVGMQPGGASYSYGGFIGMGIQPDGKIAAGGDTAPGFLVERFVPSGTPDASFGSLGLAMPLNNGRARGFAMDSSGRFLVSGDTLQGEIAVTRNMGGGDDSPDPFSFGAKNDVAPDTFVTSDPVTPTGYGPAATVVATHGYPAPNCALQDYSGTAVIYPGQTLCIVQRSAVQPGTTVTSTVTIGSTVATFSTTTSSIDTILTNTPSSPAPGDVSVSFTSNMASAAFECRLDAAPFQACTSPKSFTGLASGSHTVDVRAISGDLVDTSPASTTFTVDVTPPETSISNGPYPFGATTSRDATFDFYSNESPQKFECRLDGAPFAACTAPKSYAGLADGTHTFEVLAIDGMGLRDPTPAARTWTIDNVAPDTTITAGPSGAFASTNADFMYVSSEAGGTFECRLDGAPFAACGSNGKSYGSLAQGAHTFDVRAVDAAGNVDATPASRTWTVDTITPYATITAGPTGTVAVNGATFEFHGSETGATFDCQVDSGPVVACDSPKSYSALSDGAHVFSVRTRDAAGNMSLPASRGWTIDTTPPETTITSTIVALTSSNGASIAFQASESGATFRCRLDGAAFAACTSPASLTGLSEGAHAFQVYATDVVGNADATPASATWTVDTVPPDTTLTSTPPAATASNSAQFSFSSEPSATFECRLDGIAFSGCVSGISYGGLSNGVHSFAVRARDGAGNVDASPATYAWTVDLVPPETTLTSAPPAASASTSASFQFTSSEAGSTFECSLDAASFAACTSAFAVSGLSQGSHTFRVRAIDGVGNVDASPAGVTWTVDTVAPDTTIIGGPSGNNNPSTATFTFSSSESGGTFQCQLDAGTWQACASGVTYSSLAKGSHTFNVRAIDAAGNVDATPATRAWRSN